MAKLILALLCLAVSLRATVIVTFSAVPTFDTSLGSVFKITLTGNVTSSTLTNGANGGKYSIGVCQDAVGARTFVWPTVFNGSVAIDSAPNACTLETFYFDGTSGWLIRSGAMGFPGEYGMAPGTIVLVLTSACPPGFAEVLGLNGKMLVGTLAANSNVGGTGGSDTITPSGTNSAPGFTGTAATLTHTGTAVSAHSGAAVADHASHTHTYTNIVNHTHPITSLTATIPTRASAGNTLTSASGIGATGGTGTAAATLGGSIPNPTGAVNVGTSAGPSATLTHSVTQPANHAVTQPSDHSYTPGGSVPAAAFLGNSFDNRPAFVRVIFCSKN